MKVLIGSILIVAGLVFFATRVMHPTLPNGALVSSGASTDPAAAKGGTAPVIVELFTSEGCSSCPPADEVLATLDRTQPVSGAEVIALGEHVDYWNQLGWTDPFSSVEFSDRQRGYAAAFQSDSVYTPQMIVDGQEEFSGGNMNHARSAIAKAAAAPKAKIDLDMMPSAGAGQLTLSIKVNNLPRVSPGDTADVVLAVTENGLHSDVPRGENAGRALKHSAVVRNLTTVGQAGANGAEFNTQTGLELSRDWKKTNLRAVVFIQERKSRHILGAAVIDLAGN